MANQDEAGTTHLGDGVYASYDGYQIKLTAPRGAVDPHEVFIEPAVLFNLIGYAKKVGMVANEAVKLEGK